MLSETHTCQSCKQPFVIEEDDFSFYEKMKVPPPTWCHECRFTRRMIYRNENKLYHRTNNAPGAEAKKIISIYSDDKPLTVYDNKYWWGDGWDPYEHGHEYDFTRPFFEQMKELIAKVPWPALMNWNAVNSDYCNCTTDNKNCYLVFGGDFNEDCSYATFNFYSRDSQDLYFVHKCDLCYECSDSSDCSKIRFGQYAKNCSDCMFIYDCSNCTNCVGCFGLRNKANCIFNEQYTKEEYKTKIEELHLDSQEGISLMKKKFDEFKLRFPHRFAHIVRSTSSTGNNVHSSKNCRRCFDVGTCEDLKDVFLGVQNFKDGNSSSHAGHGVELLYESFGVFSGSQNLRFSIYQPSSISVTYAYNCPSSSNVFGCVGLKKGSYSILNRRYTKEEYEALLPKVIEHMNAMPYVDAMGREYKFGEFFPPELSPFGYDETIAFDYYPVSQDEAEKKGFTWKKQEERSYTITVSADKIPKTISETPDNITHEVLGCAHGGSCNDQCTKAFKIIPAELQFYRRLNLPLPTLCPNCRHYGRLQARPPMKLWQRSCQCSEAGHNHQGSCSTEFETPYSPEKKEILYCESCYQSRYL